MQLGMVGLGRMGANIVRRIMRDGHTASPSTPTPTPSPQLARRGRRSARPTLEEFVAEARASRASPG